MAKPIPKNHKISIKKNSGKKEEEYGNSNILFHHSKNILIFKKIL